MMLKEWLRRYRERMNYTQQDMADRCGVSKPYIAMLEKGINSSNNKPITVSVELAQKIAVASGLSLAELAEEVEDIHLPKGFQSVSSEEEKILSGYRRLNLSNRQMFRQFLATCLTAQSAGGVT